MRRKLLQWTFFSLLVSGAICHQRLTQPPVVAGSWGQDITMPCNLSPGDETPHGTILYWENLGLDFDHAKLWPPSENYQGRVERLSKNKNSTNMSILLKNVQWADMGSYLCKISLLNPETHKRHRIRGNTTVLVIYDMSLDLAGPNNTLLRCTVNVTSHPGFVLSILCDGQKTKSIDSDPGSHGVNLPYVSLSETVRVEGDDGKYECQLHLNRHLVTNRSFESYGGKGPAPMTDEDEKTFPEPWFLYFGVLSIPIITLCILMARSIFRRCVHYSTCP